MSNENQTSINADYSEDVTRGRTFEALAGRNVTDLQIKSNETTNCQKVRDNNKNSDLYPETLQNSECANYTRENSLSLVAQPLIVQHNVDEDKLDGQDFRARTPSADQEVILSNLEESQSEQIIDEGLVL